MRYINIKIAADLAVNNNYTYSTPHKKIFKYREWRKYSVEEVAGACSFNNKQSFYDLLYEQIGIRPADFIKKRKEEIHH